jgi:mRNA interferase RelE/StbE
MAFEIEWTDSAKKQLNKLERPVAKRIFDKVSELKADPYRYLIRLASSNSFGLRIGDYRVLVDIENGKISVLKVSHRKDVYK